MAALGQLPFLITLAGLLYATSPLIIADGCRPVRFLLNSLN